MACASRLGLEILTDTDILVAQSSLDALHRLLSGNSIPTIKAVIPIFSTIHPILFQVL
jgi:symplekin